MCGKNFLGNPPYLGFQTTLGPLFLTDQNDSACKHYFSVAWNRFPAAQSHRWKMEQWDPLFKKQKEGFFLSPWVHRYLSTCSGIFICYLMSSFPGHGDVHRVTSDYYRFLGLLTPDLNLCCAQALRASAVSGDQVVPNHAEVAGR